VVVEEISPYWKGKTFHEAFNASLPDDIRKLTYDNPAGTVHRYIVSETATGWTSLQWVHDYEKVLKRGFKGIRAEALRKLEALDPMSPVDYVEKVPYLKAIIIVCDAIVIWARRHADLARKLAGEQSDANRRQELLEMAAVCEWVPENPARSFHEAVQAQYFTQMFSRLEQKTGAVISNGRMDQYFYPFYKQDVDAKRLTDGRALELLECMWVGMAQYLELNLTPYSNEFSDGYAHWEAVTVGGQTPEGLDATNDLTYLFLRSKKELPLNYPDLAARIHARAPQRYLWEVAETIKEGSGFPKLFNDEEIIPQNLAKGAELKEIYDYAVSGCTEIRMPNRDTYTSGHGWINYAAALEMTLYNGRMLKYGDQLLGLETGDPCEFKTWEQFWSAYIQQQLNCIRNTFIQQRIIDSLRYKHFATPLGSALHDLCMAGCKDLHTPQIEGGLNLGFFECVGYATVVDSLCAVKKLVFEDHKLGMAEVIEALRCNFEGKEDMQQMMRSVPCYGNNDAYADTIAKAIEKFSADYSRTYSRELGVQLDLRYVPVTSHIPFGRVVSATPNGRKAGEPLSEGSSASQGADLNGPTAVLLSNFDSKNNDYKERAARLLNVKLSPSCVAGDEGTQKLVSLIRAFCDLKLWHLQFNIINRSTLLAARKEPDKYRNLIVRVAGYSAYFVDLSPELQQDIITRTEHSTF
jgi:formate C-acetyltransferase